MGSSPTSPTIDAPGRVLGIGELLWDLLPDGPRLGGAPANATAHLAALGHPAAYLTAVGDDDLGRRARARLGSLGVTTTLLQETRDLPTGTVEVTVAPDGMPRYRIARPAAYDGLDQATAVPDGLAWSPAAIVHGTLAQTSPSVRAATRAIITGCPDALVVYDANLRDGHWTRALVGDLLGSADVLRCNEEELGAIGLAPAALLARHGLRAVVVTRGSAGASGWGRATATDPVTEAHVPAPQVEVVDTIGAGDAFTAGVTAALLEGGSIAAALALGTRRAALALGVAGAMGG